MTRALRENATCALLAALGCAACAWLALYGIGWNDYGVEVQPALEALAGGHVLRFLELSPVYGGSLIERAPFALAPGLWGGGPLAVYRMVALPCLLAAAALAVWLVAGMRRERRSRLARAVALSVCVANPVTLVALETGHPEELLGAVLCVTAALLACAPEVSRRRAVTAGIALGFAIANKQWALVALGPVLLALPRRRRRPFLLASIGLAAAILAPLLAAASGHFADGARAAAAPASTVFQPQQLWWFLGRHGGLVHGLFGEGKPGYRTGPAWSGAVSHPAVLAAGTLIAAVLWARTRSRRLGERETLLALALVLLARCVLDTWDTAYYTLPFLLAMLAYEARCTERPPILSLSASALVWLNFRWLAQHASPDFQAATFLAWTLPLALWLWLRTATGAVTPRTRAGHERWRRRLQPFRRTVGRSTRRRAVRGHSVTRLESSRCAVVTSRSAKGEDASPVLVRPAPIRPTLVSSPLFDVKGDEHHHVSVDGRRRVTSYFSSPGLLARSQGFSRNGTASPGSTDPSWCSS